MPTTDTQTLRSGAHTVTVHRSGKVLFPDDGWTKADLVAYYRSVAPYMLPRLRGRPLMLERCPDGVAGQRFMQKDTPEHYPDWIRRVTVPKEGGTVTHTVCDSTATLLFLADQACITLHRWQSREPAVEEPDVLVFDLDPPPTAAEGYRPDDFEPVREAALLLHDLFEDLRLPSAVMTTGSRGAHVIVPVDGGGGFDDVRDFAREVAEALAAAHPDRLTTAVRKKDRGGRIYLDIQRNAYAQTSVAPFAVRAKSGAPVAVPLSWEQLRDPAVHARSWTIENAADQGRRKPWAHLPGKGRALGPARRRLRDLRA